MGEVLHVRLGADRRGVHEQVPRPPGRNAHPRPTRPPSPALAAASARWRSRPYTITRAPAARRPATTASRRAAGAEHRRATPPQCEPGRAAPGSPRRPCFARATPPRRASVFTAPAARRRLVGPGHRVEQRHLEGRRHARARRRRGRPQTPGSRPRRGLERQVDRVDARLGERRVVHRRRERMADRPAHDPEDPGARADIAEAELRQHPVRGQLARGDRVAGVRSSTTRSAGEQARGHARGAHRDERDPLAPPRRLAAEGEQRQAVAERPSASPRASPPRLRSPASPGTAPRDPPASPRNRGRTGPAPARPADEPGGHDPRATRRPRTRRPAGWRLSSKPSRTSSGPSNPPPSQRGRQVTMTGPRRPSSPRARLAPATAGRAGRPGAARPGRRACRLVTLLPGLLDRRRGHGDAQERWGHKTKKPLQPRLKRLSVSHEQAGSRHRGPFSGMAAPPPTAGRRKRQLGTSGASGTSRDGHRRADDVKHGKGHEALPVKGLRYQTPPRASTTRGFLLDPQAVGASIMAWIRPVTSPRFPDAQPFP